MTRPTVSVLYAPGTNSHKETLHAFEKVGAQADLLPLHAVLRGERRLDEADVLCIPGGFTYGDHTGAGNLAGQILRFQLSDQLEAVRRKPMIAICNGFQIAVRAGLFGAGVALTVNAAGTFRNIVRQEHRVDPDTNNVWLEGMQGIVLRFPCAHGEGRFVYKHQNGWQRALSYPPGKNPDGSTDDIAGISSDDGLMFGLMDHPERLLHEPGNLDIFRNGVKQAA